MASEYWQPGADFIVAKCVLILVSTEQIPRKTW